jgi:hypothetical protein
MGPRFTFGRNAFHKKFHKTRRISGSDFRSITTAGMAWVWREILEQRREATA